MTKNILNLSLIAGTLILIDTVGTAWAYVAGIVEESNPLMKLFLEHGVGWFLLVKSVQLALIVGLAFLAKASPLAKRGLLTVVVVYLGVLLYFLGSVVT